MVKSFQIPDSEIDDCAKTITERHKGAKILKQARTFGTTLLAMTNYRMNQVEERERSGASALAFLVAFAAQALAAFGAGALLARFGYGVVLAGAAALAALAAALFRWWLR